MRKAKVGCRRPLAAGWRTDTVAALHVRISNCTEKPATKARVRPVARAALQIVDLSVFWQIPQYLLVGLSEVQVLFHTSSPLPHLCREQWLDIVDPGSDMAATLLPQAVSHLHELRPGGRQARPAYNVPTRGHPEALSPPLQILASIGQLEFFYDQAPDVMRSCSMALQLLSVCIGSYASGALVYAVGRWCARRPSRFLCLHTPSSAEPLLCKNSLSQDRQCCSNTQRCSSRQGLPHVAGRLGWLARRRGGCPTT